MVLTSQLKKIIGLFIVVSIMPVWCIAKNTALQTNFLSYESKINKRQIKSLDQIPSSLKNYSLYPYLEFAIIKNELSTEPKEKIKEFYRKYSDQPVTKKLNYYWIKYLASKQRWQEIVEFYQPNKSTNLQCIYLEAKQYVDPDLITQDEIQEIWLSDKSRPKECDRLFDLWLEYGVIDKSLIWERVYLAIDNNKTNLAQYLGKYLSDKDNEDINLWVRLNRNVNLIHKPQLFNKNNLFHHRIIINTLQNLAKTNIDQSLRYFRELNLIFNFNNKAKYTYYKFLAIRMFIQDHELTENILSEIPKQYYDTELHEIAIKNALKQGNWQKIIARIKNMPLEERKADIWAYWQARAYEELKNKEMAKNLFNSISNNTNYYGLMACNKLKKFCPIEFTITKPFHTDKAKLLKNPGIQRAIELFKLQRHDDARLEWNHVVKNINEKQKFIAANIADELKWYDRNIMSIDLYKQSHNNEMLHLKYPLGYQNLVLKFAKQYNVDPAWIFAISRQESAFINNAKSKAGAIGVMQLMPATAKAVAKNNKIPYYNTGNLLAETTNISLGAAYLSQMLANHNGNPILATAAYNAGPNKVKQWTAKTGSMATDIWIELVPYKETRNYLKRVVTNTAIYRSRLGKPANLLSDIFPINIEHDK
jgi:soluble lytic murein transglycosylase